MKLLSNILSAINVTGREGNLDDPEIKTILSDSRKDVTGALFVAVRGVNVDGHTFVDDVVSRGASAVVVEKFPDKIDPQVAYIKVENTAIALGEIASQWFDNPSSRLKLIGVTGTNGKTTTATLIYEMAHLMGFKAGLLSTVKNYIDYEAVPATHTTPDPIELNSLLARMVEAGCQYAAMEVSSHAAHQHRIAGLTFAGGVFTNLTRDHLDYHKTFEAYLAAKQSFFEMLPSTAFALTNIDDKNGLIIIQNTRAKRLTYSLRRASDYLGRIIEQRLDGTLMSFNMNEVEVMFTGRFNAYNLTALYGTAMQLGWRSEQVLLNMSRLVPVAGRFQTFRSPRRGYVAIIDYAHTPDAVVNVLHTIREIIGNHSNIITVVGAGGNRDKGKRPIMAAEAAKLSDRLILTSDNPRDEDPRQIIADMREGLTTPLLRAKTISITYRDEAIRAGAYIALPGDVLLIAGKGHEDYQEIAGVRHHFDDGEVIKAIFADEM